MVQHDHVAEHIFQMLYHIARCGCGQVARVPDNSEESHRKGLPVNLLEPWREPNETEAEEIDHGLTPLN